MDKEFDLVTTDNNNVINIFNVTTLAFVLVQLVMILYCHLSVPKLSPVIEIFMRNSFVHVFMVFLLMYTRISQGQALLSLVISGAVVGIINIIFYFLGYSTNKERFCPFETNYCKIFNSPDEEQMHFNIQMFLDDSDNVLHDMDKFLRLDKPDDILASKDDSPDNYFKIGQNFQ